MENHRAGVYFNFAVILTQFSHIYKNITDCIHSCNCTCEIYYQPYHVAKEKHRLICVTIPLIDIFKRAIYVITRKFNDKKAPTSSLLKKGRK
jgi:hypothetical protein